jgi:XTP/dITP diphosphohydrolase
LIQMTRRLAERRIVVASHNSGKVREIASLLAPFAVGVESAGALGLPEPEETAASFEGNAALKALAATHASGRPALADDSGLVVPALGGAPGIESARWGGPSRDFQAAMARVESELNGKSDRAAYFVCVLALAWPDGHVESFQGEVHGHLVFPPRGSRGFGYDPIFVPQGHTITFGEMDPAEKDRMSHRARAFEQLVAACFEPRP